MAWSAYTSIRALGGEVAEVVVKGTMLLELCSIVLFAFEHFALMHFLLGDSAPNSLMGGILWDLSGPTKWSLNQEMHVLLHHILLCWSILGVGFT